MRDRSFYTALIRHPFSRLNRTRFREAAAAERHAQQTKGAVARSDGITQELIDSYVWWHSIDLGGGLVTPGRKSLAAMRREADLLFAPVDLKGCSVLDIGAWNGGFSVEAARRGAARVVGLDHATWTSPHYRGRETFDLVARATGNDFGAIDCDLDQPALSLAFVGRFDVVLYSGVFYHLRDPLAATREAAALAERVLILETHVERFSARRPAMVYYPGSELSGDANNWWGPNAACVRALLSGFGFARIEQRRGSARDRMIFHAYRG